MKQIYSCLFFIVFTLMLPAQNITKKFTISGYMKDSLSTEALISATVHDLETLSGTSTNQYGFYSLTLPAGEVNLAFSYVGYASKIRKFNLKKDTIIHINLSGSEHLQEVEITANKVERIQEKTQMSSINVPIAQIKSLPAFLGEVDLMKVLQLMPGIQSGGEGTSGLYVRGGGPDQNLILLDGVPVYNVSHLFGFFSVFNADAINNVEILKGGFPARYGGRISSVIDINMKEGNMQKFHFEGSTGIVASRLTLEGPIWKDRTSFIISGKRTYIDLLAKPFITIANKQNDDETINVGYYFYDLTAKINHKFSDKDRIYLSAYMGDDKFYANYKYDHEYDYDKNKMGLKWGNITSAFRWNHIFTNRLFSNITLTYSQYRFLTSADYWYRERDWNGMEEIYQDFYNGIRYKSGINDWSGKISLDYIPSPNHYIRFGGNVIYHTFNPGVLASEIDDLSLDFGGDKIYAYEYSFYAEDDVKLTNKLKINLGIHWSGFNVRKQFFSIIQPRLSARYLLTDQLSVKAAYSRMGQYIHLITNSNVGLPTDLWVPTTNRLDPQTSHQVAIGLAQNFRNKYEISLEGYYKTMDQVLEYKEGSTFFDVGGNWEEKIQQGDGRSYGIEFFAQKKVGTLTGWIGYTLSWTDRIFENINGGKRFPYKYDRRHDLSIVATKMLTPKIELSAVWVFGTGNSITVPIGIYELSDPSNGGTPETYYEYGERNSYRMDPYHRLDFNISFIRKRGQYERKWIIGVYNVYNRKNPFFIDIHSKYRSDNGIPQVKYEYAQYSLFPIIPSVSYQFKF
ncbi:MAG: TonB-dependent receptor [Bacteroidales bacterium]|jgi:outer membrane cobalamin receptor|nr:TonB-dependent receptor [Bacteroidales bacterium]